MAGHSDSIMIIAGPIVRSPCASFPSVPGRRTRSSALNVCLMNSISAAGSRHTSRGITTEAPSGIGLTLADMVLSREVGGGEMDLQRTEGPVQTQPADSRLPWANEAPAVASQRAMYVAA